MESFVSALPKQERINRKWPPVKMTFIFNRVDYVKEGEWFIPPMSGTLYEWNYPKQSKEKHPIYHLTIENNE